MHIVAHRRIRRRTLPACCIFPCFPVACPAGALIWRQNILNLVLQADPNASQGGTVSNTSVISRSSPVVATGGRLVLGVMKKGGGCVPCWSVAVSSTCAYCSLPAMLLRARQLHVALQRACTYTQCFADELPECRPLAAATCQPSFPYMLAVSTNGGKLLWGKRMDPHQQAMITQSPTVYKDGVYVGVSSLEELAADSPDYDCCSFIGSFVKLNLTTGEELWRVYMTPPNGGKSGSWSGNSVWGSAPAIDRKRNQVYFATGERSPSRALCARYLLLGPSLQCTFALACLHAHRQQL